MFFSSRTNARKSPAKRRYKYTEQCDKAFPKRSVPFPKEEKNKKKRDFQKKPRRNRCRRNRTFNLRIKSPMLCQLSYAPLNHASGGTRTHTPEHRNLNPARLPISPHSQGDTKKSRCRRNRTFNLRIKSPMLCQLSYAPLNHASGGTRTHTPEHRNLNPARLPISPHSQGDTKKSRCRRNRTFNLRIKSPMLCQLSYAPLNHASGGTRTHTPEHRNLNPARLPISPHSQGDTKKSRCRRNRTFNLRIKSPMLCQLSYAPTRRKN